MTFGPKERVKQIAIEIIDDDEYDKDKEFFIRLSNAKSTMPNVKIVIENPNGIVNILDNDHSGVFEFDSATLQISETLKPAEIKVFQIFL